MNMLKAHRDYKDVDKELEKIQGSWLQNLKFDDKVYYDVKKDINLYLSRKITTEPLPSDSRFREDIVWLNCANKEQAQVWKIKLEEQQRKDRKNRNDYIKKKDGKNKDDYKGLWGFLGGNSSNN